MSTIPSPETFSSPKSLEVSPLSLPSSFLWCGIFLILLGILAGPLKFWDIDGFFLFPSGTSCASIGLILILYGSWRLWKVKCLPLVTYHAPALILLFLFFTDWLCRRYSLFAAPTIRGEILLGAILSYVLLYTRFRRILSILGIVALPLSLLLIGSNFISHTEGRTLVSDDHASFIFRLLSLRDSFPSIPFYSPRWHGGFDARDFFATGALNFFILFSPLIYTLDIYHHYNYLVAFALFVLLPLSLFYASRTLSLSLSASLLSASLSVASSLLWYKWALKYGTMGFITSSILLPVVFALTIKLLNPPHTLSKREAIVVTAFSSLMLLWSPSALVFFPLGAIALFSIKGLLKSPTVRRIIFALLVINIPWMLIFVTVSKVTKFFHVEKPSYAQMAQSSGKEQNTRDIRVKSARHSLTADGVLKVFRETAIEVNPLILMFAIPGLWLFKRRARILFIATGVWLLLLGGIVVHLKPQLELDRMLLILTLLSCLPAGGALDSFFKNSTASFRKRISTLLVRSSAALCGGFIFAGPFVVCGIVNNRSLEQFSLSSSLSNNLVNAIKTYGGEGRTLFSGFVLHDLDNAHIAHLPYLTRKPLMASSPFHNLWRYRQIFPQGFIARKESGGIEEYLDLYNVTSVLSHEKEWNDYFHRHSNFYEARWREGAFTLFTRKNYTPSYVLDGEIKSLSTTSSSILLTPLSSDVLLKFNYLPFLQSSGCIIEGKSFASEVTLINLRNCTPGMPIEIKSLSAPRRFIQEITAQ